MFGSGSQLQGSYAVSETVDTYVQPIKEWQSEKNRMIRDVGTFLKKYSEEACLQFFPCTVVRAGDVLVLGDGPTIRIAPPNCPIVGCFFRRSFNLLLPNFHDQLPTHEADNVQTTSIGLQNDQSKHECTFCVYQLHAAV